MRRRAGSSRRIWASPGLLALLSAAFVVFEPSAFCHQSWTLPAQGVGTSASRRHAGAIRSERRQEAAVVRLAEKEDSGRTDEERLAFMNSPVGQAIGAFANFLANSPLNDGKIWFAKMQAGDYDKAVVGAKLDGYINDNAVVMFSFSK
mmetsp:Transcript_57806/g.161323  ORF Transcript_57806/g.161323 Transcript_57806/m.161323 type:complete len:148 (-) Transcript_57806:360-803(-)